MISFVLDQCAWEDLIDSPEFETLHPKILESIERRINRFFYTRVNFWELFKGLNESSFDRLRKQLLCGFGYAGVDNLLLDPLDRVLLDLKHVDYPFIVEMRRHFQDDIRRLAEVNDWDEFEGKHGDRVTRLCQDWEKWRKWGCEMGSAVKQHARGKSKSDLKKAFGYESRFVRFAEFCRELLPSILDDKLVEEMDLDALRHMCPGLMYISEIRRSKCYGMALMPSSGWKQGDNFDLMYPAYLDMADYLVTDDGGLRTLFDQSRNINLAGRAISVEKLVTHILCPCLEPWGG